MYSKQKKSHPCSEAYIDSSRQVDEALGTFFYVLEQLLLYFIRNQTRESVPAVSTYLLDSLYGLEQGQNNFD